MAKTKSPGFSILVTILGGFLIAMPSVCRCVKKQAYSRTTVANYEIDIDEGDLYDGHYLRFSDTFKKGMAMQDDLGISILLAVDCSGSMDEEPRYSTSGDKKYMVASQALTDIMDFLEKFYIESAQKQNLALRIGIVRFSGDVEVLSPIETMNRATFTRMRSITSNVNNFYPQDMTAIGKSLEVGAEMLAQSGTIFKSLIVITDGENTEGIEPHLVLEAIVSNRNNMTSDDFPVLTDSILVSFVGFDIESYVFNALGENGARITTAQDEIQLQNALKNLFIADITKLEAAN
jgi:Mg-chelatase subunit ChlD